MDDEIKAKIKLKCLFKGYLILGALPNTIRIPVDGCFKGLEDLEMKALLNVVVVLCVIGFSNSVFGTVVGLQTGTSTWSQDPMGQWGTPWSPENCLNGSWEAWSTQQYPNPAMNQVAAWETQSDFGYTEGTILTITLTHTDGGGYGLGDSLLGRFKISVTTDSRDTFCDGVYDNGDVDSEPAGWTELSFTSWSITGSDAPMEFIDLGDNSLLVDVSKGISSAGNYETVYVVTAQTNLVGITGIRLDALAHESLPGGGPGTQGADKSFPGAIWLSQITVDASPVPEPGTVALLGIGLMFVKRQRKL